MPTDPSAMVLDMLAETLIAINEDQLVDAVIIKHLSDALDAETAISVYFDQDTAFELVASYPDESSAQSLVDYVEETGPASLNHFMTIDHQKGVGHIVFVNISPDGDLPGEEGFARVMAFARPQPYDDESALILERACRRPLVALWPHVARVYAQHRVTNSQYNITSREREVLELLARGLLATSIASRLKLSPRTVHKHLGNIYRKLGVHDRLVAVRIARVSGIIGEDSRTQVSEK